MPGLMAAAVSGHTILTPNAELAAALFDAIERAYLNAGRDVWPTPRVRDFGTWLREQHAARQLIDGGSPRILGDIEERELWRSVIDSSDVGQDILEPAGAARAARRARRALHEYGIPLRLLAAQAADSEESRVFLDWNRRFEEQCRALDCISADELAARTAPPATPLVWIESPVWRPAARRWLQQHGRALSPSQHESPALIRVHSASPGAELAAIGEWARSNLGSEKDFRAWICIPDLHLRRVDVVDALDAALAPQRFSLSDGAGPAPYAISGGTPLAEFAPVCAALNMLTVSVDLVSFEQFSSVLRAPELHATAAENGAAALLDLRLRNQGPSEAGMAAWLALSQRIAAAQGIGPLPALQRLIIALRALDDIHGNHPVSRWVPAWIEALNLGPWVHRHRWSSSEYQAAERFRELLAALAAADSFFGTHSRRSAQRILRRAAQDTSFQAQTGIPPVWVSGQLMDPWLNYSGLWISGCNDEKWPPAVAPIPLLPVRLQREFGVIAAAPESQMQLALELQARWTARAAQCVFSYADPGDGRSAAPSPILPDTGESRSADLPRPHWRALLSVAPALERLTDELAPAFAAGERTRGVATLRAQSRCAFRGFAETRLGTERLERPVPGFNQRERGDLIHHALEHIWTNLRNSNALLSISTEAQAQLLDEGIATALAKVCRIRDPGTRWRTRERARMFGVLGKWLDVERLREPFEVEDLERGAQTARFANLDFDVRIDRVDRLGDGARVLIDYKTGIATTDWRGERPDNPQLPIYALLQPQALVAVAYGRVNAGECSFIAEAERRAIFKPRGQRSSLEGMLSFAALIDVWSQRIENLAADFAAGRAAVAPTLRACKSCRLHGLCRVPALHEEAVETRD